MEYEDKMASSENLLSSDPPASESNWGHENKNKTHMSRDDDPLSNVKPIEMNECVNANMVVYRDSDHLSILSENLKQLRKSNIMCDVEIHLGTDAVLAHKCVLAASSRYMKALLTANDLETSVNSISFPTNKISDFINILDYLYTGCLAVSMDNVQDIVSMSVQLEMGKVTNLCCKYLEETVTIDNWVEVFSLALRLKLDAVVNAMKTYAVDYFSFMSSNNNFLDIEYDYFRSIIGACHEKEGADLEMFKIKEILKWINHEEKRVGFIEDLLQLTKLDNVENVLALETIIQELTLSDILLESPVYKAFMSKLDSEKHRPSKQKLTESADTTSSVIEHTVLSSRSHVQAERHDNEPKDNIEDLPDSDATFEGYDEAVKTEPVSSKPRRVIPNVNIRYTDLDNDDMSESKNKRKSFRPKRLQLKRLKLKKAVSGRPRGRPPKTKLLIGRHPEKKPKMKTSCTQVSI